MKSDDTFMPAEPPPYPGPAQQPPPTAVYSQPQGESSGPPPYGPPYYQAPSDVNPHYVEGGKWPQNVGPVPAAEIHVYPGGQALGGPAPYPAASTNWAPQPGSCYPQQAGGYYQQPGNFVVTGLSAPHVTGGAMGTPVTVVHVQSLGPYPMQMTCQACHAQITTTTKPNSGLLTWLIAGGLCLLGCWLGCCLIPFCVDACQDVEHSCPNCKAAIGSFRRL